MVTRWEAERANVRVKKNVTQIGRMLRSVYLRRDMRALLIAVEQDLELVRSYNEQPTYSKEALARAKQRGGQSNGVQEDSYAGVNEEEAQSPADEELSSTG